MRLIDNFSSRSLLSLRLFFSSLSLTLSKLEQEEEGRQRHFSSRNENVILHRRKNDVL